MVFAGHQHNAKAINGPHGKPAQHSQMTMAPTHKNELLTFAAVHPLLLRQSFSPSKSR